MSNSGGLLQLVSTGRQDIYLSGNPQTTFFKQVYRRYTNFAIETQRVPFDTAVDFGKLITATIPRNGDLIGQMYLEVELPEMSGTGNGNNGGPLSQSSDISGGILIVRPTNYEDTTPAVSWVNGIGHAMIEYVSIWIGQQEVDRQYGEYLYLWQQLTTPGSKQAVGARKSDGVPFV